VTVADGVVEEAIVGARVDSSPGKKRRMRFGNKREEDEEHCRL
jgi:hypothetical protein